jgi:hypothetical protein
MALTDEIAVKLGLKTADFKAALREANADVQKFKASSVAGGDPLGNEVRGIHHALRTLHQFLLAGGLVEAIKGFFNTAIAYAEKTKGKLDENTLAVLRFKDATAASGNIFKEIAVKTVGGLTQAGEALGAIARATFEYAKGNKKAYHEMLVEISSSVAASKALAEIERERQKNGERYKQITAELTRETEKREKILEKNLTLEERATKAEKEYYDIVAQANAHKGDKIGQRELELKASVAWTQVLETSEAQRVAHAERQRKLLDEMTASIAKQVMHGTKRTEQAREELVEEEKITHELKEQEKTTANLEALNSKISSDFRAMLVLGGHGAGAIHNASDAALQELLRRNKRTLLGLAGNPGSPLDFGNSFEIDRLGNENSRIQFELNQRRSIRNNVRFMGEEGARRNFGGDPLIFDRLLSEFTKHQEKSNSTLDRIDHRLESVLGN